MEALEYRIFWAQCRRSVVISDVVASCLFFSATPVLMTVALTSWMHPRALATAFHFPPHPAETVYTTNGTKGVRAR